MIDVKPLNDDLAEEWGSWVDPREYLTDDPTFSTGGSSWEPTTSLDDRIDGRFLPYYQSEEDLRRIRGQARNLTALDSVAIGAVSVLGHYTLGTGFQCEVSGQNGSLVSAVERDINAFAELNDLDGGLDRELHDRARQDGEAMLWLQWNDGEVHAVTIEPDQLVEPSDPREVEAWLEIEEEFVSGWSFGVHVDKRRPHVPLNYYCIFSSTGADFEVIPERNFIHVKRNVVRTAKRGVSDFFPVMMDLKNGAKLKTNMAVGSAMQAAIAWVEEFPEGTLQSDVNALDQRLRDTKVTRSNQDGTRTTTSVHRIQPGTIVRPSPGRKYGAAPLGSERSPAFIQIAQFLMRSEGVRWTIPEYMISGDASNSNFASTLVAESPFVKAREADQAFEVKERQRMLWKVVRIHFDNGRYSDHVSDWEQLAHSVNIHATLPAVATRDPLQLAQRHQIEVGLGTLSRRTATTEAGRDYDEELTHGARPSEAAPVQQTFESIWKGYP